MLTSLFAEEEEGRGHGEREDRTLLIDTHELHEAFKVKHGVICDADFTVSLIDIFLGQLVAKGGEAVTELSSRHKTILVTVEDFESVLRTLLLIDGMCSKSLSKLQEVGPCDHACAVRVSFLCKRPDFTLSGSCFQRAYTKHEDKKRATR